MLLVLLACSEQELISHKDGAPGDDTAAAEPDITLAPAAVDFGALLPGESATALVTLGNVGTTDLFVSSLVFADTEPELSLTELPSPQVRAGESVEVVLTWTASSGPLDATLLVASDDPDEPVLALPIIGDMPAGDILVEPAFHDFGTLYLGASAETLVTVRNVGEGPLTISALDHVANDGDLVLTDPGALAALPTVLAPGVSTDLRVRYSPSAAGPDEGTVTVTSDDPDTPQAGASQAGEGVDICASTVTVTVVLTADDEWSGWMDSVEFTAPGYDYWWNVDTLEWELECGEHTLALQARDRARVTSGVLAAVLVEGTVRHVTGEPGWLMLDHMPRTGWTTAGFDDSAWHTPEVCAETSQWRSYTQELYDLGSEWIWWTTDCSDLGEAWLRLDFTVP